MPKAFYPKNSSVKLHVSCLPSLWLRLPPWLSRQRPGAPTSGNVSVGSLADLAAALPNVRFTPEADITENRQLIVLAVTAGACRPVIVYPA